MRSVDRVLENSSEVGEKADYPVYHQPCKKEKDGVHECIWSLDFAPLLCLSSSSHRDYNSTSSTLLVASLVVNPTFARTITSKQTLNANISSPSRTDMNADCGSRITILFVPVFFLYS